MGQFVVLTFTALAEMEEKEEKLDTCSFRDCLSQLTARFRLLFFIFFMYMRYRCAGRTKRCFSKSAIKYDKANKVWNLMHSMVISIALVGLRSTLMCF